MMAGIDKSWLVSLSSSCHLPCYVPRVLLQVLHAAQALEPHVGRGLPPQLASHQEEEHVNTWSTNLSTTFEHLWSSNAKTNPRRVFIEDTWMYRLKPLESLSTVEHFSSSDKPWSTSNLFWFCFSKSHFLISNLTFSLIIRYAINNIFKAHMLENSSILKSKNCGAMANCLLNQGYSVSARIIRVPAILRPRE